MTILDGDIKLLKSAVLDDVPEGGGMATGLAVVDGVSNNLFPDVSELDRTYGRISLRKVFPAVLTDTTEGYYGAHVIVAEAPSDAHVSATIFTTKSWSDTRTAAQSKLESYLAMGAETRFTLYGNHLAGQRSVQVHCARSTPNPAIGDVLALVKSSDTSQYQYVRITRLIARLENQVFTDDKGDYLRDVLTLEISDPLRIAFTAPNITRYSSDYYNPPTRIYSTFPADATSYFGVSPLAQAVGIGAMTLKAKSIYSQLVPSALSEAPIVDARCVGGREIIVPITGAAALGFTSAINIAAGQVAVRYFGSAVARGSVSISIGGATVTDDSKGNLVATAGFTGSVDYATGAVSIAKSTGFSGNATFSASPAAAVSLAGHTGSTLITASSRGYNYVKTLLPVPAPGSVSVDFMAQGKWYRLTDNGAGALSGDDGVGVGTINYATGSLVATLGALPDANSQLLFAWGSPAHYQPQIGTSVFRSPAIRISIPGGALEPGQISLTYVAGGVTKTVTDNGSGALTGAGSGTADYANGELILLPSVLPDGNSNVGVQYKKGASVSEGFTAAGEVTNFTLSQAVSPKSLTLIAHDNVGGKYVIADNGVGGLVLVSADFTGASAGAGFGGAVVFTSTQSVSLASTSGIYGTVNYATGAVMLNLRAAVKISVQNTTDLGDPSLSPSGSISAWQVSQQNAIASGGVAATYRPSGDLAGAVQTTSVPVSGLTLTVLPTVSNTIVPGSLRFTLGGHTYVDRAGSLVKDPDPATNSGVVAGAVNYVSGEVTLSDYTGGGSASASVQCLTRLGVWADYKFQFRISGAPIQPASLSIRANRAEDSVQTTVSSNLDSSLSGSEATGTVDYQFGIASVQFGQLVADASLTSAQKNEWWYDPAKVVNGQIFKPRLVLPETALFNAVAVSNLPLSADVLGLDPVRLPVDGKVPILRKGDVLVVHHTAKTAAMNVSNGQTVNLGRERIARARVIGNGGLTIASGYTANLDAGTVTFTSVSGYSQPVKIEHRIEDMALCSDVQINGDLALTRPLTHDFPLGSLVSSALIMGDLHARVSVFFDQQTWSGWSDTLSGAAATGTYNSTQYPVELTNRGAIQERWEIIFTNTGTVNVIGETVGQVVTGHGIVGDLAPINPATGAPYFTLRAAGWGQGWAAGNVLRFNTVSANYPIWVARTVLQGNPTQADDHFTIGIRGDVDAA